MSFANNLKQLRIANKMSQDKLAKKVGVCRQAISKWELGISLPDIENIVVLARIFNTSIDNLLDNVINYSQDKEQEEFEKNNRKLKWFKVCLGIIIITYFFYRFVQLIELLIICTSIN